MTVRLCLIFIVSSIKLLNLGEGGPLMAAAERRPDGRLKSRTNGIIHPSKPSPFASSREPPGKAPAEPCNPANDTQTSKTVWIRDTLQKYTFLFPRIAGSQFGKEQIDFIFQHSLNFTDLFYKLMFYHNQYTYISVLGTGLLWEALGHSLMDPVRIENFTLTIYYSEDFCRLFHDDNDSAEAHKVRKT